MSFLLRFLNQIQDFATAGGLACLSAFPVGDDK